MTDTTLSYSGMIDFLRSDATDTDKEAELAKTIGWFHVQGALADLMKAQLLFTRHLPDWWWRLGDCRKSADASCGPELETSDHLRFEKHGIPDDFSFDNDHETDRNAHPARSLIIVMLMGLDAKAHLEKISPSEYEPLVIEPKPPIWVQEVSRLGASYLWALRMTASDELIPMHSFEEAYQTSVVHNETIIPIIQVIKADPLVFAIPTIWPRSAEEHATGLRLRRESEGKS